MFVLRVLIFSLLLTSFGWAQPIRVGVAISLRDAMTEIATAYETRTSQKVEFIFGSSGQIMSQIVNGAPIDAFISAAAAQVDELDRAGLVRPETRRIVASNSLVLIIPTSAPQTIASFRDLASQQAGRIAIGEPTTVPAGQYAMQVLTKLNLANTLKPRLIYGANVRQVLSYVERGEVIAGIVYSTDARESGNQVKVVASAPPGTHDPIVYPAIVVKSSTKSDDARRFLDFLATGPARDILVGKGFVIPASGTTKRAE